VETRNRKPLKRAIAFEVEWEIRFGPNNRFRVFYEVNRDTGFQGILAAAREQIRETGGIGHEESLAGDGGRNLVGAAAVNARSLYLHTTRQGERVSSFASSLVRSIPRIATTQNQRIQSGEGYPSESDRMHKIRTSR
jgi:hypothetical protein